VEGDPSIGDLVADRFGDEVVERLVEPLLGGVYAGRSREISARAASPQLVALAGRGSIVAQAGALPVDTSPVFAGLAGGVAGLVDALAGPLDVRTGLQVRAVRRAGGEGGGYVLDLTRADGSRATERADAVVLATPAAPTARLLAELAPAAAAELAAVESASVAVVTLALARADVPDLVAGEASGFLVPPVDGRRIKASTFSWAKWGWVGEAGAAEGVLHLRTSLGRLGEETALHASDADLVARSLADLAEAVGVRATPVDTHVQRWGGALPQYPPGHLERVARVRSAVAEVPGLAVCGAAYDGVGVAAVVGSARRAAAEVVRGMMEP
jgi:oxygen-dependent protoporphyrinogen oxidase